MPVSAKMAIAVIGRMEPWVLDAAQAVINAAWKPFDADDESTWPERGSTWLALCRGKIHTLKFQTTGNPCWNNGYTIKFGVTHWANLADLMPEINDA